MKKTIILALVFLCFMAGRSYGQAEGRSYGTAVGIKFFPGAFTIKHFFTKDQALEGLLNLWDNGFRITGLYEFHGDIGGAPGLRWYVGPGAHLGGFNGTIYHGYYYPNGAIDIGIDGVIGLEYKFDGAPIAISADLQPYIELNHPYIDLWGGIGVKYTW